MANERHSYVELYPSDWMAGTSYMPPLVEWLYLQVCLYNWDKREPVPPAQAAMRFSRSPSWADDLAMLVEAGKVIKTASGGLFVERAMVAANKAYDLWDRKSRGGKGRAAQRGGQESGSTAGSTAGSTPAANQNQNQNQNQGGEPPCPPSPAGDLLFSVPADSLKAFRDHRVKIRKPMTPRAEELMIGKLQAIHMDHGHEPTAVLEQSIVNGWAGVFPLKEQDSGTGNRNGSGKAGAAQGGADGFNRAVDRRLGGG